MNSEWPSISVEECAANKPHSTQIGPFGNKIRAETYTPNGIPVLRGVNVKQGRFNDDDYVFVSEEAAAELKVFECLPNDVILVHKGTLGKIGIIPSNCKYKRYIMGNSMMRVRCDYSKVLPLFLYYWLNSSEGQNYLFSRVSQVGVPQLQHPLTTLRKATFRCPPVKIQDKIITLLGTLDDKIELNRKMNETLEAMAKAIFKSWFVDFDPVRAKMEGRDPAGMDAETAALFPDGFEQSELGEIPRGWRVGRLGDLAEVNADSINKDYSYEKIEYIDIASVNEGKLSGTSQYLLKEAPSRARRLVKQRDTIWSMVRPNRKSYLFIYNLPQNTVVSTGFAVLSSMNCAPTYLYSWVTTEDFVDYLTNNADGSAYPAVLPSVFENALMIVPEDRIVGIFEDKIKNLREKIAHNDDQSRTLARIRDALLPKLLSGEIRVGEAEKIVESAV